jgi:hypothetical protein
VNVLNEQRISGSPHENLYDPDVAQMKRRSVEDVRKEVGRLATAAAEGKLDEHTLVTRHGHVGLVIVPLDWYRDARAALGDPTDL